VISFDLRTGEPRWVTPLPGDQPLRLIIDRDTILVGQAGRGTVIDSGGRVVFEGQLPPELLVMAVVGDVMVISGQDGTNDPLVAIDLRSGQKLWSHSRPTPDLRGGTRPNVYQGLTAVDGAVLGYRSAAGSSQTPNGDLDEDLLPAVVDRIDPLTGTIQPVAIPATDGGSWIMAVGDLLVVPVGYGLVAIRLTSDGYPPTDTSPAAPDQWPDACALMSTEEIQSLWPGVDLTPVKEFATVLGRPIREPIQCHFTDRYGSVFFTVSIRWVASDPRTAETIAISAHTASAGTLWSDLPAEPLLPTVGTWAFGDAATHVTLRAGPVIATIRVSDDAVTVPAAEIARLVATRLHAQGYR
jgi:putative pyrroloquinoline-quinone binding quinoprotein